MIAGGFPGITTYGEVYRSRSRSIGLGRGQLSLGQGQFGRSVEVEGGGPLLGGKEKKMKTLISARIEPTHTKSTSLLA